MIRPRTSVAAAAALALAGFSAHADGLFGLGGPAAQDRQASAQDRLLAKAAFTAVLERQATPLGMAAPLNAAPYAPIYPQGFIVEAAASAEAPTGGTVSYAAPAPLPVVLDFYEDAAALARLPFSVSDAGKGVVVLNAGDGRRQVQARLTRQFANSTVVDLTYR